MFFCSAMGTYFLSQLPSSAGGQQWPKMVGVLFQCLGKRAGLIFADDAKDDHGFVYFVQRDDKTKSQHIYYILHRSES